MGTKSCSEFGVLSRWIRIGFGERMQPRHWSLMTLINIPAQMFSLCHTFNQTSFVSAYLSYLTVYVTSGGEPSPGVHVKIMSKSFDSSVTFWGGGSWTWPDWKEKLCEWFKISLGMGNITCFWPRWFQNLGQNSSVHLRLEIGNESRYVCDEGGFSSSLIKLLHLNSF